MMEEFKQSGIDLEQENKKREICRSTKVKLATLFKSYPTGKERINEIKSQIERILDSLENKEEILKRLTECEQIDNKVAFIEEVFNVIKPVIELMAKKPELFELEKDEQSEEAGVQEIIEINELLSYSVGGDFVFIHAVPRNEVKDSLTKMNEGLNKLAEIVNERKEIKTVEMASWIVARHPNIVKRFGFELDGDISSDFRNKYFHNDNAVIHRAHMTKEDFLERYLRKKD